jgi:plastocyanin
MRLLVLASAVLSAALIASACGGSKYPGGPSGSNNVSTITINRQAGAQSFSPNPASFGGQMVVFKNNDSVTHRVQLNDGSIDTGDIAPGATSREVLMPSSGTNYHCTLHPSMIGAVSASGGTAPPACTGIYC